AEPAEWPRTPSLPLPATSPPPPTSPALGAGDRFRHAGTRSRPASPGQSPGRTLRYNPRPPRYAKTYHTWAKTQPASSFDCDRLAGHTVGHARTPIFPASPPSQSVATLPPAQASTWSV